MRTHIRENVEGTDVRGLLHRMMDAAASVLRTNAYLPERYALCFTTGEQRCGPIEEIFDAKALCEACGRAGVRGTKVNVLAHAHVREERTSLRHVSNPSFLRCKVAACFRVKERLAVHSNMSAVRSSQPGDGL